MLIVFTILLVCYCFLILYLRISDIGDGKRKNAAGWLAFGFFWPVIKEQLLKISRKEKE